MEIGRTLDAVNKRRSRLTATGFVKRDRRLRPDSETWTAEEDAIVIATVHLRIREVAERIPCHTTAAVYLRRRDLRRRGLITASGRRIAKRPP